VFSVDLSVSAFGIFLLIFSRFHLLEFFCGSKSPFRDFPALSPDFANYKLFRNLKSLSLQPGSATNRKISFGNSTALLIAHRIFPNLDSDFFQKSTAFLFFLVLSLFGYSTGFAEMPKNTKTTEFSRRSYQLNSKQGQYNLLLVYKSIRFATRSYPDCTIF
jgi:hypothetical protein